MLTGCQPRSSIPAQQNIHSQDGSFAADVSYSGRYAAVSSLYHGVALWDLESNGLKYNWYQTPKQQTFSLFNDGDENATADNNFVLALDIAHDDSYALLADKSSFSLWNIKTGQNEGYWLAKQSKVKYLPKNDARIASSSMYEVIDANKCQSPNIEQGERCEVVADIRDVAVSNYGNHILLGKSNGEVVHISKATGRRIEFLGHQQVLVDDDSGETFHLNNAINSVDMSPNGAFALSGSSDQSAYLWDTKTGQVIYKFQHNSRVVLVALDPKGRYAFTSDTKKQAKIWDLKTGKMISNLQFTSRQEIFTTARFSQNGRYLVTGAPTRKLTLWDVKTGKEQKEWLVTARKNSRPSSAVVYSAAFINSDSQIISESSAGLSEVWNINK
ncbi:MAG: hypothetical protein HWE10_02010 [Gammaproteobacteria bacterium]|nr:hypothetical protein [Gammaproteobacteria bacterium]